MEPAESPNSSTSTSQEEPPVWTYPTRFCRICREDVPATVTMYPPGLPIQFQRPIVEYKNEDEYGRLIKPCMCRGSLRYIHELCLTRSRTENTRSGSLWKCHECKHEFNFNKLRLQHYLSSRITITFFTIAFMVFVVFMLGFIADPIINIYMDPYDSIRGRESIWEELEITSDAESPIPFWTQHFTKGLISMGLVGFLKTLFLNPFQWINLRLGGSWSTSGNRAATGRDRAVNISWIAVIIGVCSAFVFFYRWMQAVVQRQLTKLGNNIVDTQLPGDDDDLKPPPGWKPSVPATEHESKPTMSEEKSTDQPSTPSATEQPHEKEGEEASKPKDPPVSTPSMVLTPDTDLSPTPSKPDEPSTVPETAKETTPLMGSSWIDVDHASTSEDNEAIMGAHRQGWSFSNL